MKKLVCVYCNDSANTEGQLFELNQNKIFKNLLETENIKIIYVYGDSDRFKIIDNKIFLPCKDSYDELSVKTYSMISQCIDNFDFDVLFKLDASLIGYINNTKAGYRKEVRNHFYDVDRVLSLIKNDTWIRARKDYGGALLQGKGSPEGHRLWAKEKKIKNYDYIREFGNSPSPNIYSGKFYFVSRNFAKYIKTNGKNLALRHRNFLGGAEDLLIGRLYGHFIGESDWITKNVVHQNDHEKFTDFRDNFYDKNKFGKSLFIANDVEKYTWFVVPKAASRSLFKFLGLQTSTNKHINKPNETKEQDLKFFSNPTNKPCRDDYFKFTFVRNPLERIISTYQDKVNHCTGTEWELPFYAKFYGKSFEYFVDFLYQIRNERNLERHIRPQTQLVNNLKYLDFVGKVENFSSDIMYLSKILGINVKNIPNENKSNKYENFYINNSTLKKIKEIYSSDFTEFGYD